MTDDEMKAFGEYEKELRKAEKKVAGEIDPGARAVVVAVGILVAMLSIVLTHAGSATGLDVLTYSDTAVDERIKLPSRIFVYLLVIFGIGFSGLALITRRWVIAWIALAGCAVASVAGMLAVWTRNTAGVGDGLVRPSGPSVGLILGWVVVIFLTFHWARTVWDRTSYHLSIEDERRREAAQREAFGLSLQRPIAPGQPGSPSAERPSPDTGRDADADRDADSGRDD
ncbi:hypothetical protein [Gordonia shandongensis]|uniref:Rv2732c family membrane protein n=1 Tax=Gordonia shandongensis TaxID=376351 RepID=UPI000687DA24|nr:hypothetical protein [Gordonia shandongensis]